MTKVNFVGLRQQWTLHTDIVTSVEALKVTRNHVENWRPSNACCALLGRQLYYCHKHEEAYSANPNYQ